MKVDPRFVRKRHLSVTFSSVSALKSLYWTIFLSTCFLTCLLLWLSADDDEPSTNMIDMTMAMAMTTGRRNYLAGSHSHNLNSNFVNERHSWVNDVVVGEATSSSAADAGDFVTDFDVSVDIEPDEVERDVNMALSQNLGIELGTVGTTAKTSIKPVNSGLEGEMKVQKLQAQDRYQERLSLVRSYCKANPVFKMGRHRLTMKMLDLLHGRTNMWIRATTTTTSKFPLTHSSFPNHTPNNWNKKKNQNESQNSLDNFVTKRVLLEWCPVFKSASTPWMALLMKLKDHLYPRTETMIQTGKLTFVKLARMFHMQIERPSGTHSSYLSSIAELKKINNVSSSYSSMMMQKLNISMLIVRHPFERLLSAYRDKLERIEGRQYYHRKYGIPIVYKFRYHRTNYNQPLHRRYGRSVSVIDGTTKLNSKTLTTSSTSATAVLEDLKSNLQDWQKSFGVPLLTMRMDENDKERELFHVGVGSLTGADSNLDLDMDLDPDLNAISNTGTIYQNPNRIASFSFNQNRFQRANTFRNLAAQDLVPTFNEFVQYLLQLSPLQMDEHWRPFFVDCNACYGNRYHHINDNDEIDIPFNLILKVETMDEDRDFLLDLIGVNSTFKEDLDQVWKRWTNPSGKKDHESQRQSQSHEKRMAKYFSQVSKKDLKSLFLMYQPDFDMFGYSAKEYIAMGK